MPPGASQEAIFSLVGLETVLENRRFMRSRSRQLTIGATPSSKAGKGKPTLFAEPNRGFSCKTGIVAEETIDARQLNVICLLDQSGSLICSICELGLIRADSCFAMAGDNGGAIALGGSDRDPLLIAQIAACVRL